MRNLLTTICLAILPVFAISQDKVSEYIANYQQIAINEMNRSGIPASITLAQGMFESAYGKSPSAIGYNNHFGIKCKKEWTGPYYYKHDDDRDEHGKLIPSCFRAYASVAQSFEDHTNFLVERERYGELFNYPQTDYYNWAMGLQRCGYATNKMYGKRLVEIIERYALYQFDVPQTITPVLVSSDPIVPTDDDTPTSTDAFSTIVSSSEPQEEVQVINESNLEVVFEKSTPVTEPIRAEEELKTLIVLDSFQEFSSVSASKNSDTNNVVSKPISPKMKPVPVSRVNQAILLPANYRRKSEANTTESSSLDQR